MSMGNFKFVLYIFMLIFWGLIAGHKHFDFRNIRNGSGQINEADYLTRLIDSAQRNGLTYQFQQNADNYRPEDENKVEDFGTFDFIVVGGGSGGSVVASRLSEYGKFKVLLLDAGNYGNDLTDIPNMYFPVDFTEYNWGFFSTPQKTCCLGMVDRKCILPRGRGIGGSTLINGEVYARGSSMDFDRWAKHVNDSRWSYAKVLPYFKKSEDFHHRNKAAPVFEPAHGKGGLLNVEYHLPEHPQVASWLEANREIGSKIIDYNAGTGLGASQAQLNTKNGRRYDGGKAFIRPFLNRKNLHVLTHAYVTKILIDNLRNSAKGVLFAHGNRKYSALARKEVIISAGAFQTPQLLMLSGIGPKKHLESHNITVLKNLEVGTALKDHPAFYGLVFSSNYSEPIRSLREYVDEYLEGYGPLTAPGNNQGVGFYESQFTRGTGYPDIEIMIIPSNSTGELSQKAFSLTDQTYGDLWKSINVTQSFVMYIVGLHSESTGSVRLNSSDPYDYPIIDVRFISDPKNKDIDTIYEGIQLALKLSKTKALQKINAKLESRPMKACDQFEFLSKAYWYCAIRQVTMNLYHPMSTCPMGPSPENGDVVDSEGRVHGVKKLRVADASVFPFTLAGHPNAPTVLIGEIVSDCIKNKYL